MQHVGPGGQGDIGAIVDGQQSAVAACGVGQDLERFEFLTGLKRPELFLTRGALVTQLDQVDAAGECRVGEFGQVTAFTTGVGAQIQRGALQALDGKFDGLVHTVTVVGVL